jgi:predicted amidophosphoribosyltransferase
MDPPTLHPIKLPGPWSEGFVLERQHTLSSTLIGHDSSGNPQFDTKRSELGELVYRLKNRGDRKALAPIAEAAVEFIKGWAPKVAVIVPVPPSRRRAYQPVIEIAKAIGTLLSVPVDLTFVVKAKDTPELKNVFDFKERTTALQGAFKINEKAIRGKRILLVDDLYRSGATASIVAKALTAGGATTVYMLAMTKTRTRT